MRPRALLRSCLVPLLASPALASPDGLTLYRRHCASCHDTATERAPSRRNMKDLGSSQILHALTDGVMQPEGKSLSVSEREILARFLGKIRSATGSQKSFGACGAEAPAFNPASGPAWSGWGNGHENARFQSASNAGLAPEDVPKLRLRWAFALPRSIKAGGQPAVVGGWVFLGSFGRDVFALDARTGCVHWSFKPEAGVRTAVSFRIADARSRGGHMVFFADLRGNAYALNAVTGKLIWKTRVEAAPARITGAPLLHADRLYVPVSSDESHLAVNPRYECCRFRGSLVALDAVTGGRIWQAHTVQQAPQPQKKSPQGTQLWGPSGGAVWSAPTLDLKRRAIYVATGNAYSVPATDMTNAVIAFDMDSGKLLWSRQFTIGDVWNESCDRSHKAHCPAPLVLPDNDFGSSPVLRVLPDGRRMLLLAQKAGAVYAVDPDQGGKLIWERVVTGWTGPFNGAFRGIRARLRRVLYGAGAALGGIQWGVASDGERVYAPISAMGRKAGGLSAFRLDTGEEAWHFAGTQRPQTAFSAAATAIPGAVFAGSTDGRLWAFSSVDGKVLWSFDTARSFQATNHIDATGGAIWQAGPVIADGMVFVNSGYGVEDHKSGNVFLAFSL